ncbi:MAG: molybdenum cofactor guanylyltransferase MobA [Pseudomonadota bacterium]|nr:molybdenum cofactor guanylyltransferase MobA [Pseudomonadota bacterium]
MRAAAVILAGGQGERMGRQDKGLVLYRGAPMLSWTLKMVRPLVAEVFISCNRNQTQYAEFGCPLVSDSLSGFQGPLAGVQAALAELNHSPSGYSHLLVLPCDTPLLEPVVIEQLLATAEEHPTAICIIRTADQPQFLHAIIPVAYAEALNHWLASGNRAAYKWYRQFPIHFLDLPDNPESFKNINSPEQLD